MHGKRACIIVDMRDGDHIVKIPDLLAVLNAAGWKTEVSLKEYGGETLKLAQQAALDDYDLVLGYGGDGTLNAVVNGVMYAGGKSVVADLPGGTFNEWAGEIGLPDDAVKAALALVDSYTCEIDLGFFQVEGLTLPTHTKTSTNDQPAEKQTGEQGEEIQEKPKKAGKNRQYFLLHAGLGADAAIMAQIDKPLKYHVGPLAFDLSSLKELPQQRPFPVEIHALDDADHRELLWQGDAWQILVNNTRRYGGSLDISPDAYLDDGLIDVAVITAGGGLTTIQEAINYLLRHKVDEKATKSFRGTSFSISVPASIQVQLDGSVIQLDDYLHKDARNALKEVEDASKVMLHYRFEALPAALRMAIPRSYDSTMFEKPAHKKQFAKAAKQRQQEGQQLTQHAQELTQQEQHAEQQQAQVSPEIKELQEHGREVTVVGVGHAPDQHDAYIIAGTYHQQEDDKIKPAAVCIDKHTHVLNQHGEPVASIQVENLHEGEHISVEGKKNKRGVIQADRILVP